VLNREGFHIDKHGPVTPFNDIWRRGRVYLGHVVNLVFEPFAGSLGVLVTHGIDVECPVFALGVSCRRVYGLPSALSGRSAAAITVSPRGRRDAVGWSRLLTSPSHFRTMAAAKGRTHPAVRRSGERGTRR
jgi:hypothetical protein